MTNYNATFSHVKKYPAGCQSFVLHDKNQIHVEEKIMPQTICIIGDSLRTTLAELL